jgi:hypothetical protein
MHARVALRGDRGHSIVVAARPANPRRERRRSKTKGFGSLLVATAIASVVLAPSAIAHTYSPTHYAAPCSSGYNAYQPFFHVLRPANFDEHNQSTWGSYKAVRGTATVTDLDPCTSASSSYKGWSMVNVVNGEVFPVIGASTYAFVQFGFARNLG